jgi:hypothetical protein
LTSTETDPLKGGDHRAALTALRDILADAIRLADANVVPQVAARLQSVLAEIAALPAPTASTPTDEVRRLRERRRQSA